MKNAGQEVYVELHPDFDGLNDKDKNMFGKCILAHFLFPFIDRMHPNKGFLKCNNFIPVEYNTPLVSRKPKALLILKHNRSETSQLIGFKNRALIIV